MMHLSAIGLKRLREGLRDSFPSRIHDMVRILDMVGTPGYSRACFLRVVVECWRTRHVEYMDHWIGGM